MPKIISVWISNTSPASFKIIDHVSKEYIQALPLLENDDEIYVIVPAEDIFLATVKLPKLSLNRLIKAVPYALEVNLAENIEHLHFALGKKEANFLSVAVVSKEKMNEWISQLATLFSSTPPSLKMMLPETLTLPREADSWTLLIDETKGLIRTDDQAGFAIELPLFWQILYKRLQSPSVLLPRTIKIIGKVTTAVPEPILQKLQQLQIPLEQTSYTDKTLLLSHTLNATKAINLLQGAYKIYAPVATHKKWYMTGVLALTCLVIFTLGNITQLFILSYQNNQLRDQIKIHFNHVFPRTPFIEYQLQNRVQQELQLQRQHYAESDFLRLMRMVIPTISQATGVKTIGIEYANQELTFELNAPDFILLGKLTQALKSQNLEVNVEQEMQSGNTIQARLKIREII